MTEKFMFPNMLINKTIHAGSYVKSIRHNVEGFIGDILTSSDGSKEYAIITEEGKAYFCKAKDLRIVPLRV